MNIKENDLQLVNKIYYKHFNKYTSMQEDLLQEGFLVLCECYTNGYNNNENAFNRYCYLRIKGAMMNYVKRELNYRKYFSESVDMENNEGITLLDKVGTFDTYTTNIDEFIEYLQSHNPMLVDVAVLLLNDTPQEQISYILNKSIRTVKYHVSKIKEVYKIYKDGDVNGN